MHQYASRDDREGEEEYLGMNGSGGERENSVKKVEV